MKLKSFRLSQNWELRNRWGDSRGSISDYPTFGSELARERRNLGRSGKPLISVVTHFELIAALEPRDKMKPSFKYPRCGGWIQAQRHSHLNRFQT